MVYDDLLGMQVDELFTAGKCHRKRRCNEETEKKFHLSQWELSHQISYQEACLVQTRDNETSNAIQCISNVKRRDRLTERLVNNASYEDFTDRLAERENERWQRI